MAGPQHGSIPGRTPGVISRTVGDEFVVIHPETKTAHSLSGLHAQVWRGTQDDAPALAVSSDGLASVVSDLQTIGLLQSSGMTRRAVLNRAGVVGGLVATAGVTSLVLPEAAAAASTVFNYPGATNPIQAPAGATSVRISIAGGGGGARLRADGGDGASFTARIDSATVGGKWFNVTVGTGGNQNGTGATAGFGAGGSSSGNGGGGGAGSCVRIGTTSGNSATAAVVLVAGGGGGAGSTDASTVGSANFGGAGGNGGAAGGTGTVTAGGGGGAGPSNVALGTAGGSAGTPTDNDPGAGNSPTAGGAAAAGGAAGGRGADGDYDGGGGGGGWTGGGGGGANSGSGGGGGGGGNLTSGTATYPATLVGAVGTLNNGGAKSQTAPTSGTAGSVTITFVVP